LAHFEKSGARIAQNPAWSLHFAICLLDRGQKEKALDVLEGLPENDASDRFDAGVALGQSHLFADAARFFGTARSGYRDPYAAGYNQTLMLVEAGKYDEAVRVAEELFERGLERAELYNLVSRAHVKAGRI